MKKQAGSAETIHTLTDVQLRAREKAAAALTCDVILIIFVLGCLCLFFFIGENEQMDGVKSLRYFTVNSCIVSALVSTVTAGFIARWLHTGERVPRWATALKFTGISAICITFTVTTSVYIYTLFTGVDAFGTELGFDRIMSGSNLFMHLICPLLGIASLMMEPGCGLKWRSVWLAYIPMVVYAVLYVIFALHISNENGGWSDIYAVASVGVPFTAVMLGTLTLAVSAGLMKLQHLLKN